MYRLNTTAARLVDQNSARITQPGEYIGVFTCAEAVKSSLKSTQGIKLMFETEAKQKEHFSLWTLSAEGKELYGHRQLNALMVCLGIDHIQPTPDFIKTWDNVDKPTQVFKGLMNKKIGVLLDTEAYGKQDGQIRIKVVPVGFFNPDSRLIASEILDGNAQPQRLAELVETLKHRPFKRSNPPSSSNEPYVAPHIEFSDMDDDIPF
ncbi:hypothetical protein [Mycoavidus sp. SF9855]|uniref:hypothetical protein n=1 Tax=Mycoavidus sp. SF9855 TaxID=2968475 RepID=UPI00211C13E9|nr:hypothetical protein [Mycoavidus sp. SF9855]UUM20845.1 hypothetical protein NQD60_05025 [Mycoavidus sp. SF9855]